MKRVCADSNGWISYFAGDEKAELYAPLLEAEPPVPSIVFYEVYRWALREVGEDKADSCAATMLQGGVLPLSSAAALEGASIAHKHQLPACDALIYAICREHGLTLVTSDEDLKGLPGVEYHEDPRKEPGTRKARRAAKR
ncbi:MAG TPA: type II toxin-antitoxin system VapC family toxin [Myxococcota bacterium]|nr:type II toxin-antitoxin system VapC family toxin [Myxococcota bacterium]